MYTESTIAGIINYLMQTNYDRIAGYTHAITALREGQDTDLRTLFHDYIEQSRQFNSELLPFVIINGERLSPGNRISGKLHRFWLDIKAHVSGHDRKGILEECERGEDATKKAYQEALKEAPDLPDHIVDIIRYHAEVQKAAHDHIRDLRDNIPGHNHDKRIIKT